MMDNLHVCYGAPFLVSNYRVFVALAALGCGQKVRTRAREVDPKRPDHVSAFYMFLWKIFYVSYVFLPLAR